MADYFEYHGMHYLVIVDRLSGWTETYRVKTGTKEAGAAGLIVSLKRVFGIFGVPKELSSARGPEFIAADSKGFLERWGVVLRYSSAYNPQSNGRAELAVKATKRLLEENIGPDGKLDTDNFTQAMLIYRNTPDPICKLSPSEVIFGRKLRDTMPRLNTSINVFFNTGFRPVWRNAWAAKESALRTRYQNTMKRMTQNCCDLPTLEEGDKVAIQNQCGSKPTKWDRSGVVVDCRDYDKYVVKVDGSGRLTARNRRFLRKLLSDKGLFSSGTESVTPSYVAVRPFNKSTSSRLCSPGSSSDLSRDLSLQPIIPVSSG